MVPLNMVLFIVLFLSKAIAMLPERKIVSLLQSKCMLSGSFSHLLTKHKNLKGLGRVEGFGWAGDAFSYGAYVDET